MAARDPVARIPATNVAPEHIVTHNATQPWPRARLRIALPASGAMAIIGTPRKRGSLVRISAGKPPRSADSVATMIDGRATVEAVTATLKPDALSSYANLARTSSSSIASSTSGRIGVSRRRRSSMRLAFGIRQPVIRRHISGPSGLSVWFLTERAGAPPQVS
jgi:hypothetical protein